MSNGKAKVAARLRKRGLLKWTEREHRELRKPNIVSLSQPRIRLSMQFTVAPLPLLLHSLRHRSSTLLPPLRCASTLDTYYDSATHLSQSKCSFSLAREAASSSARTTTGVGYATMSNSKTAFARTSQHSSMTRFRASGLMHGGHVTFMCMIELSYHCTLLKPTHVHIGIRTASPTRVFIP